MGTPDPNPINLVNWCFFRIQLIWHLSKLAIWGSSRGRGFSDFIGYRWGIIISSLIICCVFHVMCVDIYIYIYIYIVTFHIILYFSLCVKPLYDIMITYDIILYCIEVGCYSPCGKLTYPNWGNPTARGSLQDKALMLLLLLLLLLLSLLLSFLLLLLLLLLLCYDVRHIRKGTNGGSTNGATADFVFFDRGFFGVLLLTCFYLPKSARAYPFPRSVKKYYFCSGPLLHCITSYSSYYTMSHAIIYFN